MNLTPRQFSDFTHECELWKANALPLMREKHWHKLMNRLEVELDRWCKAECDVFLVPSETKIQTMREKRRKKMILRLEAELVMWCEYQTLIEQERIASRLFPVS